VNRVADALSRRPRIFSVLPLQTNLRENILTLQCDDDWYKEVKDFIGQNKMMVPRFEGFMFDNDGLLRFKNQIYVPPNDELRSLILNEAHREVYMAHPGVMKMREDLKPLFFWKGMKEYIVNYVARCLECQQVKVEHRHPPGLLQPPHVIRWILNQGDTIQFSNGRRMLILFLCVRTPLSWDRLDDRVLVG
jgi:hypothetical protein